MSARAIAGLGVAALIAGVAVIALATRRDTPARVSPDAAAAVAVASDAAVVATPAASNVTAADYVGPDTCGDCHEDNHARWQASLHATMNQRASAPGAVRGDFANRTLTYGGGVATFSRDRGGYLMTLAGADAPRRRFRVTRTIGTRYLQEYVGVQIEGPESPDDPRYATEVRLPFGYWFRARGWFPQPYFDSWWPDEYFADGTLAIDPFEPETTPWATRCAWCHNTYPFELRAVRSAERDIGHGPERYVELIAAPPIERAAVVDDNLLPVDELVTVGISCESCHLGGRDHADGGPIHFVPSGDALRPRAGGAELAGGRANPTVINSLCAQCHSTPTPRFAGGAAMRNSSEALDQATGSCATAIKCTDCHDPHQAGPGPGAPDQARHLDACTTCHPALASPEAARAHSRHADGSASCLDCHMPRIVQGLSAFVRSHHISSPTEVDMLAAGELNACNLCHLDRSIAWTVGELAAGWGVTVTLEHPWQLAYGGSFDAPLGTTWLASDTAGVRLAAAAAFARSPSPRDGLPSLLAILDSPVAYDRMWILFAIEDIVGRRLTRAEYDPLAPPARRATQAAALWSRFVPR